MRAAEQTGLDISARGGAATEVAAGILPAVEPGFQPRGGNAEHAANHCEFNSPRRHTLWVRAAGCRPRQQPGWLPLRPGEFKCQIVATNSVKHVSFGLERWKKFGRNKLFTDPNRLLERSSNW